MTAGIQYKRSRCEQPFNFFEPEESLFAVNNQARRWGLEDAGCAFNLGRQRRNVCAVRGLRGPSQCSARTFRLETPHRDSRNHKLVSRSQSGGEYPGVEIGKHTFGLVEPPDQKQPANLEIPGKCRVQPVSACFEGSASGVERFRRPAQIARSEGDFCFGHHTPRASDCFFRSELASSTS